MAGNEIYDLINKNFRLLHNLPLTYPWEDEEEIEAEEIGEEEDVLDQEAEAAVTEAPPQPEQQLPTEEEDAARKEGASAAIVQSLLGKILFFIF